MINKHFGAYYECFAGVYSTIMQWISAAIMLRKIAQRVLELITNFCTECVASAILTVINTKIDYYSKKSNSRNTR